MTAPIGGEVRECCDAVQSAGRVVATFDDDPSNYQVFRERWTGARNVLVQLHPRTSAPSSACASQLRDFGAWLLP